VKVAIFGGTGEIGRQILEDVLARGHAVTASARDASALDDLAGHENLIVVEGDVTDPDTVAEQVAGHDAVISAVGGLRKGDLDLCSRAATSLVEGLRKASVKRLIFVGTAGTLKVEGGLERMDMPYFPEWLLGEARAQRAALAYFREQAGDLDWTYISPPIDIVPGERRGGYRFGTDELLRDENGESRISIPDYSDALLDELEDPKWVRRRFTLAY
jgi:putative NADH-flavin reductase